jgi:hypothetical protein
MIMKADSGRCGKINGNNLNLYIIFTWQAEEEEYYQSDSKVMRLIFFWLYGQYCSPPTQTAV